MVPARGVMLMRVMSEVWGSEAFPAPGKLFTMALLTAESLRESSSRLRAIRIALVE